MATQAKTSQNITFSDLVNMVLGMRGSNPATVKDCHLAGGRNLVISGYFKKGGTIGYGRSLPIWCIYIIYIHICECLCVCAFVYFYSFICCLCIYLFFDDHFYYLNYLIYIMSPCLHDVICVSYQSCGWVSRNMMFGTWLRLKIGWFYHWSHHWCPKLGPIWVEP